MKRQMEKWDAIQREMLVRFCRERMELAAKLGWEPAEDEPEFYYSRNDEGPVHTTELWPVLMAELDKRRETQC